MRVITISDTDDTGEDEAEPLLVAQVDGAMIRAVLELVTGQLAGPLSPKPPARPVVAIRAASPPAPKAGADRNDP
jgi:hypothetical protein